MTMIPRLGLSTLGAGSEPSAAALALLAGLAHKDLRVQHFRTLACPMSTEFVCQATGLPGRHLDSWLMPDMLCRSVFARGAAGCDLAVVEGMRDPMIKPCLPIGRDRRGPLGQIAEALDLPIIAVVSCRGMGDDSFHLPCLPEGAVAILLDEVDDPAQAAGLKRLARLATDLPVIGAIEWLPQVRSVLAELTCERFLPQDVVDRLARSFLDHADVGAITEISRRNPMPEWFDESALPDRSSRRGGFRVAYASDEIFGRYFPDTIDALEGLGAELVEFSPLRDESLPPNVDLVMIGCGFPDLMLDELASNFSMTTALRAHVCRGRRIYSEGGGTAYLGRTMIVGGRSVPGAGILPFHAELIPNHGSPTPVVRTLLSDCWLGPRGTTVRGYRTPRWRLTPSTEGLDCPACHGVLSAEGDWFFHHHAVGSLLHLYLPALPEVVSAFADPHPPSLRRPLSTRSTHGDQDSARERK